MIWHSKNNELYASKNGCHFHITQNAEKVILLLTVAKNATVQAEFKNVKEAKQWAENTRAQFKTGIIDTKKELARFLTHCGETENTSQHNTFAQQLFK